MPELSLRVHEYVDRKDGSGQLLVRTNPYVRLAREGSIAVFVQGGLFFGAGGTQIEEEDLPQWVWEDLEKLSPRTKKEVGVL